MVVKGSQDTYEMIVPDHVTDIGVKVSGGADSAILLYMIADNQVKSNASWKINTLTSVNNLKPYQEYWSQKVIDYVKNKTGAVFNERYINTVENHNYIGGQNELKTKLYQENKIQWHAAGITANPPISMPCEDRGDDVDHRPHERNRKLEKLDHYNDTLIRWTPFLNTDKKGIAELYNYYNVLDDLFPLTRSCENPSARETKDYTVHCGQCWFCQERFYGFGRLV